MHDDSRCIRVFESGSAHMHSVAPGVIPEHASRRTAVRAALVVPLWGGLAIARGGFDSRTAHVRQHTCTKEHRMLSITRRIAYTTWEGEKRFAYVRNFTLVG